MIQASRDRLNNARYSTRIVTRLRLGFAAILIVAVATAAVVAYQLQQLRAAQKRSAETSVPALIYAQSLQSQLLRFDAVLRRLGDATTLEEIERLHHTLLELDDSVRRTGTDSRLLAGNVSEHGVLVKTLAGITSSIPELVTAREGMLDSLDHIATLRSQLAVLREQMRQTIEPALLVGSTSMETLLAASPAPAMPGTPQDRNRVVTSLVQRNNQLSEILFRSYAAIDLADQLSNRQAATGFAEAVTRIRFNIRTITQILTTLNDRAIQQMLAGNVKALQVLIFRDEGTVAQLEAYRQLEARFDGLSAEQVARAATIADVMSGVVDAAKADLARSDAEVDRAIFGTILWLAGGAVLVLLIVVYFLVMVIERQINRRVTALTRSVMAIAEGDVEHEVGVAGGDELGRMASALGVFKSNAAELRRSNVELQEFAYAASHDIKTPLHDIVTLSEWTLEDADDLLPESCRANLLTLVKRAQRLLRLQSDMLSYSMAGEVGASVGTFAVEQELAELAEMMDVDNRFPISVRSDAPAYTTYITPLRQILLNLYTNAIKHHDRQSGAVDIRIEHRDGRLYVRFTDDGPGIEARYHSRVFDLFKTLAPKDEVEGSGIGLAMITRLVLRHEGSVGVESDPASARGSTFIFDWPTLPSAANDELAPVYRDTAGIDPHRQAGSA